MRSEMEFQMTCKVRKRKTARRFPMRIAITGGTGFVGRHLANRLISEGHEVVLIARHEKPNRAPKFVASDLSRWSQLAEGFESCANEFSTRPTSLWISISRIQVESGADRSELGS